MAKVTGSAVPTATARVVGGLREARLAWKLHRGLPTPRVLIHYVTNLCNLRCKHCFYWKELNTKTNDLSLDEIGRLASTLTSPLEMLLLTGGETFMFKQLVELCETYSKSNGTRNFQLTTNGYYTDVTVETVEKLCSTLPANIHIQISIDGLAETHNEIRQHPKSFDFATSTIRALAPLRAKFSNLTLHGLTVISSINQEQIEEIGELFVDELGIPVAFELVRGTYLFDHHPNFNEDYNPLDAQHCLPNPETLREVEKRVARVYQRQEEFFGNNLDMPLFAMQKSIEMFEKGKGDVPCLAGNLQVVLYPDGNVAVCELFNHDFNIRDFDLDWQRLYASPEMKEARRKVDGCFCNHGCFLQPNLGLHPRNILRKALHGRYVHSR